MPGAKPKRVHVYRGRQIAPTNRKEAACRWKINGGDGLSAYAFTMKQARIIVDSFLDTRPIAYR